MKYYTHTVEVQVGDLKGMTLPAHPIEGGEAFTVLDKGDELWYDAREVVVLFEESEMDCE